MLIVHPQPIIVYLMKASFCHLKNLRNVLFDDQSIYSFWCMGCSSYQGVSWMLTHVNDTAGVWNSYPTNQLVCVQRCHRFGYVVMGLMYRSVITLGHVLVKDST